MKKLIVLGGGESGTGAAILGQKQGYDVFVSDMSVIKENYKKVLESYNITFEEGQHTEDKVLNADLVVKSPGIPDTAPLIVKMRDNGIKIVSEIEFAGYYNTAKTVCITGSNGKTTTTLLIYDILKASGLNVGLAGNVGDSFARQVAEKDYDYYVIELSSFQLDGMYNFKADIAILLNITPDHLDRYEYKMSNYIASKFRILQNQTSDDFFIYFDDDKEVKDALDSFATPATKVPFSFETQSDPGAFITPERIMEVSLNSSRYSMPVTDIFMRGKHNACNSMAATVSAMALQISDKYIREALINFRGVEHRLEQVIKVRGIEYINDSKATNVNAAWYALESVKGDIVWIVGGVDKGNDYSILNSIVEEKVSTIICLGVDNIAIHNAFNGKVKSIIDTSSMNEAVKLAYKVAAKNSTVLLSPACASFDLFDNYEDRGRQFKKEVRNL